MCKMEQMSLSFICHHPIFVLGLLLKVWVILKLGLKNTHPTLLPVQNSILKVWEDL